MIHTASCDEFLEPQGIKSYFHSLIKNLNKQVLKEIELVFVDTFHEPNRNKFEKIIKEEAQFCVKHVPIHKEHRYWYDKGYTYISAAKNTGIIYADGELCVTCDDAEFFPDDFLERYWNHYKEGHYMLGMHNRLKNIVTENGFPVFPIQGEIYVNDHRINAFEGHTYVHTNGSWAFAGTSFALQDGLQLNGFNERMDGCKSLEDCEFGLRLRKLGRKFIQDKSGIFYIVDHQSYGNMQPTNWEFGEDGQKNEIKMQMPIKKKIDNLIAIENYGIHQCTHILNELVANKNPLTNEHWEIIKRETLKYRNFDPLAEENKEKLQIWKGVPTFDLISQREILRKSSDWRW